VDELRGLVLTSNGRNVLAGLGFFLLIHTIAIRATYYVIVINWIPFKFSNQDGKGDFPMALTKTLADFERPPGQPLNRIATANHLFQPRRICAYDAPRLTKDKAHYRYAYIS